MFSGAIDSSNEEDREVAFAALADMLLALVRKRMSHADRMYVESMDICQSAVREVWERHLGDKRKPLPHFETQSDIENYMARVAWTTLLGRVRTAKRQRQKVLPDDVSRDHRRPVAAVTGTPMQSEETEIHQPDARVVVEAFLSLLEPEDARILDLLVLQGKTSGEAASILGISAANVRKRKERHLAYLRKKYAERSERDRSVSH
ncbi:MAG: sigma-70 family RNA polymerase sigma factor [Phycisphaeraceae bacterium]